MPSEEICPKCNSENVRRIYSWTDVGVRTVLEILGIIVMVCSFATGGYWYIIACLIFVAIIVVELKYPRKKRNYCVSCNERFPIKKP